MAKDKNFDFDKRSSARTTDSIYARDGLQLEDDFINDIQRKNKGLIRHDDGSIDINGIRVHRTGLEFIGDISEAEWETFGDTLVQIDTAYQWIVGDYLTYGMDNNYGRAQGFAELMGRSSSTVNNWVYVSRNVEFSRRRENLSHGHHQVVASLSPEEQDEWLESCIQNAWSVSRLRDEIDGVIQNNNKPSKIPASFGRFIKSVTAQQFNRMSLQQRIEFKQDLQVLLEQVEKWEKA